MRRWMRDRNKRRKQPAEQPGQENPAPLQPKFPEPLDSEGEAESQQPDFEAQPQPFEAPPSVTDESQPSAHTGGGEEPPQQLRRERSRRRGRRGRGSRPQAPAQAPVQAPVLPRPGGPTGEGAEAAEADEP